MQTAKKPGDLEKIVKQQKRKQAQLAKHWFSRFEELSEDPMGTVLAGIFLLSDEFRQIVQSIRSEYRIAVPADIEERERYLREKFTGKQLEKIWKKIYKQVGADKEIKDFQQAVIELANCPTIMKEFKLALNKKPGRPKKKWLEWPQLDIAHTVFHWALVEIIWPLPRYFYNPELKLSPEGVPITVAVFSSLSGRVIAEDGAMISLDSGKRNGETLIRDAYYYLLRNESEPKVKYIELAQYLIRAGFEEIKFDPCLDEDEYDEELLRISHKIAKCCTRHEQWLRKMLDSPA